MEMELAYVDNRKANVAGGQETRGRVIVEADGGGQELDRVAQKESRFYSNCNVVFKQGSKAI